MGNIVFNVAKGRVAYLATLPGTSDALIAVPFEAVGLASDATMQDYQSLFAISNGSSNEQAIMGRKTLTSVTATVNYTDNRVEVDAADPTWTAADGSPTGALVICYWPDTTVADDTLITPLVKLDFSEIPDGVNPISAVFPTGGFYWAS